MPAKQTEINESVTEKTIDEKKLRMEAELDGAKKERKRVAEIQRAVKAAGLGEDFFRKLIDDGVELDRPVTPADYAKLRPVITGVEG